MSLVLEYGSQDFAINLDLPTFGRPNPMGIGRSKFMKVELKILMERDNAPGMSLDF